MTSENKKSDIHDSFEYPMLPTMTFKNFVVTPCNQPAYDTCLDFAKNPINHHNVLFIYGDVGCGKTHLQDAIGNDLVDTVTLTKDEISKVSGELFVRNVSKAIQRGNVQGFRNYYHGKAVLLLDNVQFMIGKSKPQKELHDLFDFFYDNMKPMVFTCDRHPSDLEDFEITLRSRFEWGKIVEITPPDMETRITILNMWTQRKHIGWPDEVTRFIASNITGSARTLIGFSLKLDAYASWHNIPITLALVEELYYRYVHE